MEKVKCSHNMGTTNFVCNNPETGQQTKIALVDGIHVRIDERIAAKFPNVFTPVAVVVDIVEIEDAVEVVEEIVEPEANEDETIDPSDEIIPEELVEIDAGDEEAVIAQHLAEITAQIDAFKTKKKLNEWALAKGVDLDEHKTLKQMKATLKETWKLA